MYSQIAANKRKTWLLIALFVGVLLLIGYAFYQYTGEPVSVSAAAVIAIVMALFSYYAGDTVALRLAGARPADPQADAYVVRMVENLAITAGLPMPKVYLIEEPAINAFATGRDPQHASVAVTRGAVQQLENEELEGVLAHELAHVANYDIRLMTVVIVLVGLASLLSDWFVRLSWYRGSGRSDRSSRGGAQGVLAIVGLIFLILAPIIAKLIQLAVSRRREFLADASGALLTRYPEGLARALEKIGAANVQPMRHAHEATAHLYISSPFGFGPGKRISKLFSTHPPLAERIAALRQMA